ncbi:MAG: glycosyl hydrolase-related protein [Anaerolineae bacterium]|nr:glycosyl hydrolase-related protein [Anaerolineae bacterium]MCX8068187.1 glycosyl hydrolase-related protein [Anaerolineae bacterium]
MRPEPYTLHIVSHTHWDREWYRTYQQFRFRLVRLVEELLDLMDRDPAYRFFLLDGQTVVLEDVVDVRPDLAERLRQRVREGRLFIGPWFVLPDEFLVSPEALVRNLLWGDRIARAWGTRMAIGYVPDTFGHISQLPQLLRGFGMETAVIWRGVGDAPTEFRWAAPDGTEVLVCYLRDSYSNAAHLPADEESFARALEAARDSLSPHATTSHLLLMQGTDHMFPRADLSRLLAVADARLPDRVVHSSLPAYVDAVRAELGEEGLRRLPLRTGEMRDPSRAHLLPGVLSTRMWIKIRNHVCQTLLERWAEPFAALSGQAHLAPFVRRAWKYLLENHPHDSICGCSVDQVHREMRTRFDWCEQIGEEVVRSALEALAAQIDTEGEGPALVVFNPSSTPRTDRVVAAVTLPIDPEGSALVGPDGRPVPFQVLRRTVRSEMEMTFDRETMRQTAAAAMAGGGFVYGDMALRGLTVRRDGDTGVLTLSVGRGAASLPLDRLAGPVAHLQALLEDESVRRYVVRVREDEALEVAFVARDVPPLGYAVYRWTEWSQPIPSGEATPSPAEATAIENEFLRVEVDPRSGLLTITDKETGLTLRECHRFVDGGDAGDEYNYCPPSQDMLVAEPATPPVIQREAGPVGQSLALELTYRVPEALSEDRSRRSDRTVEIPIAVRVWLTPGVRRVDFETTVENTACDHRLRVHFPVPFIAERAWAEGHWDVVEWSPVPTVGGPDWAEQPVPTRPQRGWVSLSDGTRGVTVANRGLPEVEVVQADRLRSEIALTLLRCVGWLSRDDFPCRRGHAGPALPVPEAQCPGRHTFRYALVLHPGDWRQGFMEAEHFQTDLRALAVPPHPGAMPPAFSFVRVDPPALRVSALKPSEDGPALILRLWNIESSPVEGTVRLWRPFARIARAALSEQEEEPLAVDTDTVHLTLRGRQVVTLRLEPNH